MGGTDLEGILARVRQGNADEFRALVERHSTRVFRLAFRMTGNEQDAEDVVQESFLRAYRNIDRFEARSDFLTWLYRIVTNCALDFMRSRGTRQRLVSESEFDKVPLSASGLPDPEHLAIGSEFQRRIASALDVLTPMERTAFILRHYEELSIQEIARTLGVGNSAAKQGIFRAVHKLRVALASERVKKT